MLEDAALTVPEATDQSNIITFGSPEGTEPPQFGGANVFIADHVATGAILVCR